MPWRLVEAVDDNDGGKVNLKPSPALRAILEPMLEAAADGPLSISSDRHNLQDAIDPGLNEMAVSAFVNPNSWNGSFIKEDYDDGTQTYYWIHSGFWKRFKDIPAQFFAPWQTDSYYFGMGNPIDASSSPTRPYSIYMDEAELSGYPGVMNPPYCSSLDSCVCHSNASGYLDDPPGPGAIGGPYYIQYNDGSPTYIPYRENDAAAWHAFYIAVNEDQNLFAYISVDHATETNAQVDVNDGYRLFIQTVTLYHTNYDYQYFLNIETDPDPDPEPPSPTPDPYDPYKGDSLTGDDQTGGRDIGDTPTDFGVTDVVVPKLSGLSTGFFTAYRIGESILDGLAQRLWNPTLWDSLKDKYRTPAEMIIGLYLLPVTSKEQIGSVPDPRHYYANNNSTENVALGGVTISGCAGHRVSQRWPTFKFGKVQIKSRWDGYPDYKKFKNVKINLPFIGEQELDTNELMSKYENVTVGEGDDQVTRVQIKEGDTGCELRLEYKIDVLTGTCVALIYVNDVLKYQFSGECSVTLPTTWQDSANVKSSFKSSLGAAIATGIGAVGGFLLAGPAGAVGGGIAGGTIGSKVTNNTRATGQGHTNGGFGSIAGPMQSNYPWVQITYPNVVVAENQDHFIGRAAPYTTTLGAAQGYVKCVDIHLENCTATDSEKAEILDILKEGVIV